MYVDRVHTKRQVLKNVRVQYHCFLFLIFDQSSESVRKSSENCQKSRH